MAALVGSAAHHASGGKMYRTRPFCTALDTNRGKVCRALVGVPLLDPWKLRFPLLPHGWTLIDPAMIGTFEGVADPGVSGGHATIETYGKEAGLAPDFQTEAQHCYTLDMVAVVMPACFWRPLARTATAKMARIETSVESAVDPVQRQALAR
mmetsp:Transcript_30020/g.54712  ORF Transcript_30020/g.54712 Transcript_30020/m.54712 type:complete len:152 (+) Transcript_30020:265-720(+)